MSWRTSGRVELIGCRISKRTSTTYLHYLIDPDCIHGASFILFKIAPEGSTAVYLAERFCGIGSRGAVRAPL